jgi:hypothetical protein
VKGYWLSETLSFVSNVFISFVPDRTSIRVPALPGCHTQGETLDEVRANLREAAEGWLAVAHDDALARDAAGGDP